MQVKWQIASIAIALLAGCGAVGVKSPSTQPSKQAVAADSSHVKCDTQQQKGCLEIRVGNYKYDATNPLMVGLDRPPASQEERQRRVQFLAPLLWKEYQEGKVTPASGRTVLVMFWNVQSVSVANMSAYRISVADNQYRHTVAKVQVNNVTGKVATPVADTAIAKFGHPSLVVRLAVDLAGSIQVPYSMFTGETYMMVCTEDGQTVYPLKVGGANQGLITGPKAFAFLRDKNPQSTRTLQVVLSQ